MVSICLVGVFERLTMWPQTDFDVALQSMDPVNLMSPSEAPEDQLLLTTLPAETIPFPGSPETNAMDRERCEFLMCCVCLDGLY